MRTQKISKPLSGRLVSAAQSIVLLVLLTFLGWTAFSIGFASFFTAIAARTARLDAANSAIRFNARDPEAHYTRAGLLMSEDPAAANADTTQAVALRPRDSVFWLGLAQTRELIGDISGAIDAATQASLLAPAYAHPRWRLGNILVRAGRTDEGFRELRGAAESNPALLPAIVDLAWQLSGGDTERVKQSIKPSTPAAYIGLANYFMKRNKATEAVEMIHAAGDDARDLRRQFINELVSTKRFQDAHSLWLLSQPAGTHGQTITNPGFEQPSDLDEPGFGWRARKDQAVLLSLNQINPAEGKSSLEIEFKGDPQAALITQLVMVEPNSRYQLNFAARTKDVVSGGLPALIIIDAVSGQQLGDSSGFPKTTDGWSQYNVPFNVPGGTFTIQITLQRNRCSSSPCPIFGQLWLDSFSLKKL